MRDGFLPIMLRYTTRIENAVTAGTVACDEGEVEISAVLNNHSAARPSALKCATIINMDAKPPIDDRTAQSEKYYFANSASLRVFGSALDFDAISTALNLRPTHSHRKGEKGRLPTPWDHDMWSYDPPVS